MRNAFARPVPAFRAAINVARNIAARDALCARDNNHDMGKVLAGPTTRGQGFTDWLVGRVRVGVIAVFRIQRRVQRPQAGQRVHASPVDGERCRELPQQGAGPRQAARLQHVPVVAIRRAVAQGGPAFGRQAVGQRRVFPHFQRRIRRDCQGFVRAGNIEVIDRIAEIIGIGKKLRMGSRLNLEGFQILPPFGARLHVQRNDAFTDRLRVAEAGDMSDRIKHAGQLIWASTG